MRKIILEFKDSIEDKGRELYRNNEPTSWVVIPFTRDNQTWYRLFTNGTVRCYIGAHNDLNEAESILEWAYLQRPTLSGFFDRLIEFLETLWILLTIR